MARPQTKSTSRKVRVKVLEHASGLPLPEIQSEGAAGLDLLAAVPDDEPIILKPGARELVPTGLLLELPLGTEAQVRPRSGLAVKYGITVLNSPGTIDSDYRGEVKVLLINLGEESFTIRRGERVAQMVVAAHVKVRLVPAKSLTDTERGTGGFGSTGKTSRAARKKKTPIPGKATPASRKGAKHPK